MSGVWGTKYNGQFVRIWQVHFYNLIEIIYKNYVMALDTENMVRLLSVEEISRGQIYELAGRTFDDLQPRNREDLAEWLLINRESLGIKSTVRKEDLIESFKRGEDALDKSNQMGITTISRFDPDFPLLLRRMPDGPLILNVKGLVTPLNANEAIAVVGTRDPSEDGKLNAEQIGHRLGEYGINVVSGLAVGTDSAAHIGSLKAGGLTTAVLAHGLDTVYPKENEQLAHKILDGGGSLISEYMIGTKPVIEQFIERNRIIAGLSKGTVVVEADLKGGTMHTARYAMEFGRMLGVYDSPEHKNKPSAAGNEFLLGKDGVLPLRSKEDLKYMADSPALGYSRGYKQKI
jgi:DNA processing protein